jgi:CheY-like chemotaxis protein
MVGPFHARIHESHQPWVISFIRYYEPMPWILAVVSDLMFTVKIQDAAKRAGAQITFVASHLRALERLKDKPALVILDLNFELAEPIQLISQIKAAGIPSLGYLSHVQTDLKRKADEAGCDSIVARSTFSQKLPELIAKSLA